MTSVKDVIIFVPDAATLGGRQTIKLSVCVLCSVERSQDINHNMAPKPTTHLRKCTLVAQVKKNAYFGSLGFNLGVRGLEPSSHRSPYVLSFLKQSVRSL